MRDHAFFSFSITTSFVSILLLCIIIIVPILNYGPRANFDRCTSIVASTPQNCSDTENQVCQYFANGTLYNQNRVFITEPTCKRICGDGFAFWDVNDILSRFFQWVAPAIVLLAHYHFPPLAIWNYAAVLYHLLGDPIDSIWSMLCRIQVGRVFYHKAKGQELSCFEAVATIWCAYDEIGYQDPSRAFLAALDEIRHRPRGGNFLNKYAKDPDSKNAMMKIEIAAQQLISHRSESALTTWFAIFGLIAALGGAYARTWIDRENNQTGHMIAQVVLLFVIIPMIKLSGNIGAFTSSIDAINIIQELRLELGSEYHQLFPPLSFPNIDRWDGEDTAPKDDHYADLASLPPGNRMSTKSYARIESTPMEDMLPRPISPIPDREQENRIKTLRMLQQWPEVAAYKGMNSIWRPQKHRVIGFPRSLGLFFLSFVFALSCSWVPALSISYYTPLVGFSCRSLAWTVVALLWVLSIFLDWVFKLPKFISKASTLWRITVVKDTTITFIIIAICAAQQLGLYNSCWCRAGGVREHMTGKYGAVNLTPFTNIEWAQGWILWASAPTSALALIVAFIGITELFYSDSGKLLNRSQSDKDKNLIRLKELEPRHD